VLDTRLNERMRILFLSQIVPYPPHGGVLQRGYNLLRELARSHEIHLLAFIHPDILPDRKALEESRAKLLEFLPGVEYFPLRAKNSRAGRLLTFAQAAVSPLPFSVIAHHSRPFERRVHQMLSEQEFDLVHFDTIALARFKSGRIQVPCVVTHQNIESTLLERRARVEKQLPVRLYVRWQARKLRSYEIRHCPRFDHNVMVSAVDGEQLKRMAPGVETTVVANGVDIEYFSPRGDPGGKSLIYVGGMNMFANRDAVLYFLESMWPRIQELHPESIFTIVGTDPPEELVRRAQEDRSIRVTGWVDDVRPYIAEAALYVVPLRVGGGTRLKIADAMAMGKAIVSTSIGCEGIELEDGVNAVIADEPGAFVRAVDGLLQEHDRRRAMGAAARLLAENSYSWPIQTRRLEGAYQAARQKHGSRSARL
jgi:glycosyltransferase involved in cell wall biosynthesis